MESIRPVFFSWLICIWIIWILQKWSSPPRKMGNFDGNMNWWLFNKKGQIKALARKKELTYPLPFGTFESMIFPFPVWWDMLELPPSQ